MKKALSAKLRCRIEAISHWKIIRRSLDARKKPIVFRLRVVVNPEQTELLTEAYQSASLNSDKTAIIVGFGPAGMFAALELLEAGIRPIVIERGSEVRNRRRDVVKIFREREVDPESNYCFGEGGAGTFSDGKLYTRSKKRGNIRQILQTLVKYGADPQILYDARPHIGTNKLPEIVVNIRNAIRKAGGEVHFDTKVEDFIVENQKLIGVRSREKEWRSDAVILATGHSARDIFKLLAKKRIRIEAKEFALGVRIEHPQDLIDRIQYKCVSRDTNLPPAAYSVVRQIKDRGVFSFCMCPGGIIAPAMTASDEIVVNGWSPSKRNGDFANSGFVVQVKANDWSDIEGDADLRAMKYQGILEKRAFIAGGSNLTAPAQRAIDFVKNRISKSIPETSYIPGVVSADLREVLPKDISQRIAGALRHFNKIMPGYGGDQAVMVGIESRTSSPVRIPRERESLEHPEISGLYPCGEGAGYAGGIMSAALDGIACARKIAVRNES